MQCLSLFVLPLATTQNNETEMSVIGKPGQVRPGLQKQAPYLDWTRLS